MKKLVPRRSSQASPRPSAGKRQTTDERAAVTHVPGCRCACRPLPGLSQRSLQAGMGENLVAESGDLTELPSNTDGRGRGLVNSSPGGHTVHDAILTGAKAKATAR